MGTDRWIDGEGIFWDCYRSAAKAEVLASCLLGEAPDELLQEAVELWELVLETQTTAFRAEARGRSLLRRMRELQIERDARRQFSPVQRQQLFDLSGGCCWICGVVLGPDWHADHYQPWSKGGPTTIENGLPLCPTCNLRKGARLLTDEEG